MSLDIEFNKTLTNKEITEKTSLKIVEKDGNFYLVDEYDNTVIFKGRGITSYGSVNITKILDELITAFEIMFIDDDDLQFIYHNPNCSVMELSIETMTRYGYIENREVKVPIRDESEYLPFNDGSDDGSDDLPF
jgi:hypothetical protein